jgi:VWFA-related protein
LGIWTSAVLPLQSQQASEEQQPSLRVTSTLVFLDLTVVDKNGKPVTEGLEREDFWITENGRPQRIFSFEAPEVHVMAAGSKEDDPDGKAPAAIFVLDRLNCSMDDFERGRGNLRTYLAAQPDLLNSPAEIMLMSNNSFEMVQGYTRSKEDLLWAVDHIQPAVPYKFTRPDFAGERAFQSISALMEIAAQNVGVPGRKNVFWIGPGGPSLVRASLGTKLDLWRGFMHATINQLVESRMSVFVIFPALQVAQSSIALGTHDVEDRASANDRLETGDVNFVVIAQQTGGSIYYNRNDVSSEIGESRNFGANYYTITYQPTDHSLDGKYRKIRVDVSNPNLHVMTKRGYFALDNKQVVDPQQKTIGNITHAAMSTIAFNSLGLRVTDVQRDPEAHTAQFTVRIKPKNLGWIANPDGKKTTELLMGITSLSGSRKILAWKFEHINLQSTAADPDQVADELRTRLTANIPTKTKSIRIVLETADAGRIGTADVDPGVLEAAPVAASKPAQASPAPAALTPRAPES